MKRNNKRTTKAGLKEYVIAVVLGFLTIFGLSTLVAVFIHNEYLDMDAQQWTAPIVQLISALICGLVVGRLSDDHRLFIFIVAPSVMVALQAIAGMLLFEHFSNSWIWSMIASFGGGGAAAYLCKKTKRQRYKRKMKTQIC